MWRSSEIYACACDFPIYSCKSERPGKTAQFGGVDAIKADGSVAGLDLRDVAEFAHTLVGRKRLDNIQEYLAVVKRDNNPETSLKPVYGGAEQRFI